MTLEIIEGFAAGLAAPQRLAGGRAEFRQQLRVGRAALRARNVLHAEQCAARVCRLRRCDAVFPELAAAVLPVVGQAGDNTVRIFGFANPSRSSASSISSAIMFMAGQPE